MYSTPTPDRSSAASPAATVTPRTGHRSRAPSPSSAESSDDAHDQLEVERLIGGAFDDSEVDSAGEEDREDDVGGENDADGELVAEMDDAQRDGAEPENESFQETAEDDGEDEGEGNENAVGECQFYEKIRSLLSLLINRNDRCAATQLGIARYRTAGG